MSWEYLICLYTGTHCTARGLSSETIAAYKASLEQFQRWADGAYPGIVPQAITARHVLEYVNHLRGGRGNGDSIVGRHVTILKCFYRATVAMGHMEPAKNPMAHFPRMKTTPRKLPRTLIDEDVERLTSQPSPETVLGRRDRAIMVLLCGTGIRASECARLRNEDVRLGAGEIFVRGKGGHERVLPVLGRVVDALRAYAEARGELARGAPFFVTRAGRPMSRGAVYERVRTTARRARIEQAVSPHQLRHTFATQMMRSGSTIQEIRDYLGHRCISSTQIYTHVTAKDLQEAAARHPIGRLAPIVESIVPRVKLPIQRPPMRTRRA